MDGNIGSIDIREILHEDDYSSDDDSDLPADDIPDNVSLRDLSNDESETTDDNDEDSVYLNPTHHWHKE